MNLPISKACNYYKLHCPDTKFITHSRALSVDQKPKLNTIFIINLEGTNESVLSICLCLRTVAMIFEAFGTGISGWLGMGSGASSHHLFGAGQAGPQL